MATTQPSQGTVYVVGDGMRLREDSHCLEQHPDCRVNYLSRPSDLSELDAYSHPCCVLAELPGEHDESPGLQQQLHRRGVFLPIIFVSPQPSVEQAVQAMEMGAITVMRRPLSGDRLQAYTQSAFRIDSRQQRLEGLHREISEILGRLSQRQQEILEFVVAGMSTRGIAQKLQVSQRLVEKERSAILQHFNVSATPDVTLKIGEFRILNQLQLRFDQENLPAFRCSARSLLHSFADRA